MVPSVGACEERPVQRSSRFATLGAVRVGGVSIEKGDELSERGEGDREGWKKEAGFEGGETRSPDK